VRRSGELERKGWVNERGGQFIGTGDWLTWYGLTHAGRREAQRLNDRAHV
jgi:hypothetical protein